MSITSEITRIKNEVNSQTDLISQIATALEGKASGSGGVTLPELSNPGTAADLLADKELIDADGNVVTGTMATATQATPTVTVSSAGLITAKSTQTAGYVAAGTKSATKQLTTQAAQTITPGTSNKTIASGRYLTGTQTIKGDANLVAGNIKSGISIFGVAGSYEGSGSGGASIETCTVTINFTDSAEGYGYADVNGPVCYFNKVVSGTLQYGSEDITADSYTLTDVAVGSILYVRAFDLPMFSLSTTGATLMSDLVSHGQIFAIEETAQITWS